MSNVHVLHTVQTIAEAHLPAQVWLPPLQDVARERGGLELVLVKGKVFDQQRSHVVCAEPKQRVGIAWRLE